MIEISLTVLTGVAAVLAALLALAEAKRIERSRVKVKARATPRR